MKKILKKRNYIFMKCCFLILLLFLVSCTESGIVTRVIDGDTLVLQNGEKVRLICVDTPERGEKGFKKAKEFLEQLVLNKKVLLEKDITNRDKYDRLLRYVYVNDIFVNKEIVKQGYGKVYRYEPDTKRCKEIEGN